MDAKIEAAAQLLAAAERELSEAVGALRGVPRAEKTVTTRLVEEALERVTASRARLSELEAQAGEDGAT
jgi:hypothetical protein